jgi:hypothetical protein
MKVNKIASVFDTDPDRNFLSPIAMSQLQRAYKGRKREVVLGGIKYRITYGFSRMTKITNERVDSIRINRDDGQGFVPMGYVPVKDILDFTFEGSDDDGNRAPRKAE